MPTIHHTIRLLSPMSHGSLDGDTGNALMFRRAPVVVGSRVIRVPCLSAGALRGVARRVLWRDVFDRVGLSREVAPGLGFSWDRLYAALANGGTIESAEKRVDPDRIRARRAALPVLSLLGSALYSSHMSGRAKVSASWLACSQLGTGDLDMGDLMADETRVRHADREEQDPDASGVGPMPTTIETIVCGAELRGHTHIAPELEASAWAYALDRIHHLGGKSGQGFGEVQIAHDGDGSLYEAWLAEHLDAVRNALIQLGLELGPAKTKKAKRPTRKAPAPAQQIDAIVPQPDGIL